MLYKVSINKFVLHCELMVHILDPMNDDFSSYSN